MCDWAGPAAVTHRRRHSQQSASRTASSPNPMDRINPYINRKLHVYGTPPMLSLLNHRELTFTVTPTSCECRHNAFVNSAAGLVYRYRSRAVIYCLIAKSCFIGSRRGIYRAVVTNGGHSRVGGGCFQQFRDHSSVNGPPPTPKDLLHAAMVHSDNACTWAPQS